MNNDKSKQPTDDLDRLVQKALQIRTDEQSLVRLQEFWRQQRLRQRRRSRALIVLTAAAASLAIVMWSLQTLPSEDPSTNVAINETSPSVDGSPIESRSSIEDPSAVEHSPRNGRPPTAYEQFVFTARRQRALATNTAAKWTKLQAAIDQLVKHPDLNPEQLFADTGLEHGPAEYRLLRQLRRFPNSQQQAVVKLLRACGSSRSTPMLLNLARKADLRPHALATLEQLVGVESLASLVGNCKSYEVRATLMRRLLAINTETALRGYLTLCSNRTTRDEALAILKRSPQSAIDQLFGMLDHEEQTLRLTAALVLGYLNGPTVTQALITRILDDPANAEDAWVALIGCRGNLAENFKTYAAHSPQLLSQFNSARMRWAQIIH